MTWRYLLVTSSLSLAASAVRYTGYTENVPNGVSLPPYPLRPLADMGLHDPLPLASAGRDAGLQVASAVNSLQRLHALRADLSLATMSYHHYVSDEQRLHAEARRLRRQTPGIESAYARTVNLLQVAHQIARIDYRHWSKLAAQLNARKAYLTHWQRMLKMYDGQQVTVSQEIELEHSSARYHRSDAAFYLDQSRAHRTQSTAIADRLADTGGANLKTALMTTAHAARLNALRHRLLFQERQCQKLVVGFSDQVSKLTARAIVARAAALASRKRWRKRLVAYQRVRTAYTDFSLRVHHVRERLRSVALKRRMTEKLRLSLLARHRWLRRAIRHRISRSRQDLHLVEDSL